jgi:lipopolysaccharide export system protein LptA
MTVKTRIPFLLSLLVALPLVTVAANAQVTDLDLRLPWDIDAESTSFDGKTSMIIFRGLRLSQGRISIDADEGRASNTEGEDGFWQFNGNVVINVDNGRIACDSADLRFAEYQLKQATVSGSPATFELKRSGTEDVTYAEAGKLSYDVVAGVIEFSEEATITEAGNQISSNFLVYDINQQRISAESSGSDDDRVRITYTPTNGSTEAATDDAEPSDDADEADNP